MDLILEINWFGIHQSVSFIEEVFKIPIFGPVWALGPKKGGTCKIKIWKSKKKSYFGAKNFACHLGEYVAIYILKI